MGLGDLVIDIVDDALHDLVRQSGEDVTGFDGHPPQFGQVDDVRAHRDLDHVLEHGGIGAHDLIELGFGRGQYPFDRIGRGQEATLRNVEILGLSRLSDRRHSRHQPVEALHLADQHIGELRLGGHDGADADRGEQLVHGADGFDDDRVVQLDGLDRITAALTARADDLTGRGHLLQGPGDRRVDALASRAYRGFGNSR